MSLWGRARSWARSLKGEVVALWLAARDPRTPRLAKAVAAMAAAYALSPIDLIPDFVPVLGYIDDLLIVPLGIMLAVRLIPPPLMAEFRRRAAEVDRPTSKAAAMVIVTVWLVLLIIAAIWLWRPGWLGP